jgi:hypothetical protein
MIELRMQHVHLFPYGRGDVEPSRRRPLSKKRLIQAERLLRLSTGDFQESTFVLSSYNSMALKMAAQTAWCKVKLERFK